MPNESEFPKLVTAWNMLGFEAFHIADREIGDNYVTGWGWNDAERAWYEYHWYKEQQIPFRCLLPKKSVI